MCRIKSDKRSSSGTLKKVFKRVDGDSKRKKSSRFAKGSRGKKISGTETRKKR